jgi:hypothetical protein
MLRRNVSTMSGKMIVILNVPVSKEVGYIYLIMIERFGKSCFWNGFMIFWNVRTRLQDSEKSTYVDGVSRLSGIAICE